MVASSNDFPSPFSLTPTGEWDGIDGNWTTFKFSIGTPHPQNFRVLISTSGSTPWLPIPAACQNTSRSDCAKLRGVEPFLSTQSPGFQMSQSKTWKFLDHFQLQSDEDFGSSIGTGQLGNDTVRLGYDGNSGALTLNNTLAVGMNSDFYYMGLLGIGKSKTGIAGGTAVDSFIDHLKHSHQIPSSSYGYTAGAKYQHKGVPGSLVLGGFDKSRFESAGSQFFFTQDEKKRLKVGIQSITTSQSLLSQSEISLLPSDKPEGPWAYIDSSVAQLWLPQDVCDNFKEAFGLDDTTPGWYFVNETTHNRLLRLNPTIRFQLGNDVLPGNNTSIVLPYLAFAQWISNPESSTAQRYFPLRVSDREVRNTIGRVFLQEAYLIVDHDRGNFSLSQATFADSMPPPDIHPIYSPNTVFSSEDHGISPGAKAGIATAAVIALLLVIAVILFRCWWMPRRQEKGRARGSSIATSTAPTYQEKYDQQPPGYTALAEDSSNNNRNHNRIKSGETWVEMPAEQVERRPELEGTQGLSYELADNHEPAPVHEMEANATGENNEANVEATDGGGKVSGEKTCNKKRGRRASIVPF